jgi:hypothetical protein
MGKQIADLWVLKFIYISILMMIQNHVKSNDYSIYRDIKIFQKNLD